MDEPLSNLDAKLREQMRFELKALQESFGITTVYVTHDQEEAMALSDRIGLMHEGALIEVAAPSELYLRPAHRVTADFLGSANFVPARVERAGNQPWDEMLLITPLGSFAAQRSVEWQPGMEAELFFRPESIEWLEENCRTTQDAEHGNGDCRAGYFSWQFRRRADSLRRDLCARANPPDAHTRRGQGGALHGGAEFVHCIPCIEYSRPTKWKREEGGSY